jgi:multiple sugar transport system substrate-binding protein
MQSLSRRQFLNLVAGSAVGTALAGCVPAGTAPDGAPQQDTQGAAPAEGAIDLRIGWWGGLSRNELYNQICDLYQERNPGITLVREYAAWADYWTKVATQAAGGNLPDITASVIDTLSEYALRGAYESMEPFIEAGTIKVDDWDPVVLDSGKVNDVVYMMPTGSTINCVVVNHEMIERLGVEPPAFETSFDQFTQLCSDLKAVMPEDTWPSVDPSGAAEPWQTWLRQHGEEIASEDATDIGFSKETVVAWFDYWYGLYQEGMLLPIEISSQPLGDPWADHFLSKGQVAMHYTNSNQLKIYQQYIEDDLVIIRSPTLPEGVNPKGEYLRPSALSIATNSQYKDEVAKFIDFFVNDIEATKIFNLELGAVGPKHVQDALRETVDPKDVLVLDHFNAVLQDIPPKVPNPKGSAAVLAALTRAREAIVYGGSIDEAVDTMIAEAKESYAANKS